MPCNREKSETTAWDRPEHLGQSLHPCNPVVLPCFLTSLTQVSGEICRGRFSCGLFSIDCQPF